MVLSNLKKDENLKTIISTWFEVTTFRNEEEFALNETRKSVVGMHLMKRMSLLIIHFIMSSTHVCDA